MSLFIINFKLSRYPMEGLARLDGLEYVLRHDPESLDWARTAQVGEYRQTSAPPGIIARVNDG